MPPVKCIYGRMPWSGSTGPHYKVRYNTVVLYSIVVKIRLLNYIHYSAGCQSCWKLYMIDGTTLSHRIWNDWIAGKEKERKEYLYSAIYTMHNLKALRHGSHSFTCKLHAPCLPFLRKRLADGATPNWDSRHPFAAYYSFIDYEGIKG